MVFVVGEWCSNFCYIFSVIFTGESSSLVLSRDGWRVWYSENLDPTHSEANLRIGKILATNGSDGEEAEQVSSRASLS